MKEHFKSWEEFEKELQITPEEEQEIAFETEIIKEAIKLRKNNNLSQEELSKKAGLKQSALARLESGKHSPNTSTLIKILYPMGYTLKIAPIKENHVSKN